MRLRAIRNCLFFGLLPWWCYESERHYDCTYWEHLMMNAELALRWLTFRETLDDVMFEIEINC